MIAHSVHPVCAAFLRFAIATFFLLLLLVRVEGRIPVPGKKQMLPIVLLGMTGVFAYNILFLTGLRYIQAGRAALIVATNPVFISLLSALFFRERLNWTKGVGICLSVAGAMIVITNGRITDLGSYRIGTGELLIAGCVLSWVAYSLIGKSVMAQLSPLTSVAYSAVVGTVLLLPPALYSGIGREIFGYTVKDWADLFYLGFFGTVLGFSWYYQGIKRIGPMKASVFINFVPVSAIVLASLILKEQITVSIVLGTMLVITGVYLTNASGVFRRYMRKPLPR